MKAETALARINKALFPTPTKMASGAMLDQNAYYELEGALIDLERTGADRVCIETVRRVQKQINEVSNILRAVGARKR